MGVADKHIGKDDGLFKAIQVKINEESQLGKGKYVEN